MQQNLFCTGTQQCGIVGSCWCVFFHRVSGLILGFRHCNASKSPRGCSEAHTRFEKLRFSTVLSCLQRSISLHLSLSLLCSSEGMEGSDLEPACAIAGEFSHQHTRPLCSVRTANDGALNGISVGSAVCACPTVHGTFWWNPLTQMGYLCTRSKVGRLLSIQSLHCEA